MTAKPMMIAELSSTELGGSKSGWIASSYPRIKAVVWFDENKESDWRINSSATALAACQRVAMSPGYRGMLP